MTNPNTRPLGASQTGSQPTAEARVLILFAHPALEKSRVNCHLIEVVADLPGVTFHDLYEHYPNFDIDIAQEQALLVAHEIIVLQHPFYWYSTPALVKQWEDLVLQHDWAYGSKGTALKGKYLLSVITAGGSESTYQKKGIYQASIRDFLLPLERTAMLCCMTYLPPFIVFGTHQMEQDDIEQAAQDYARLIEGLRDDRLDLVSAQGCALLNENFEAILKEK